MGKQRGGPPNSLWDVFRRPWGYFRIELFGSLLVAAGANDREFRLGHPRFDRCDPDSGAAKVGAEVERELPDESLRARVNRASLVGIGRGDRRQVDDRALALRKLRKERSSQRHQAGDIGFDHRFDAIPIGIRQGIGRRGKAGIVQQEVDLAPRRFELRQALEGVEIAHVDLQRQESIAQLFLKRAEAISAPAGADDAPAALYETPRRRLAEARRRSGNQDRLHSMSLFGSSSRRTAANASGFIPICSETARRSGSCASRKPISAESSAGSPTLSRNSSVPIPVRSRNR